MCEQVVCVDKLCVDKLGVSKLCVDKLGVSKLCVDKLGVSKLCVSKLCVNKLCLDKLCVCVSKFCVRRWEAAAGGGGGRWEGKTKNKNPTQRCGEKQKVSLPANTSICLRQSRNIVQ